MERLRKQKLMKYHWSVSKNGLMQGCINITMDTDLMNKERYQVPHEQFTWNSSSLLSISYIHLEAAGHCGTTTTICAIRLRYGMFPVRWTCTAGKCSEHLILIMVSDLLMSYSHVTWSAEESGNISLTIMTTSRISSTMWKFHYIILSTSCLLPVHLWIIRLKWWLQLKSDTHSSQSRLWWRHVTRDQHFLRASLPKITDASLFNSYFAVSRWSHRMYKNTLGSAPPRTTWYLVQ